MAAFNQLTENIFRMIIHYNYTDYFPPWILRLFGKCAKILNEIIV